MFPPILVTHPDRPNVAGKGESGVMEESEGGGVTWNVDARDHRHHYTLQFVGCVGNSVA